VTVFEVVVTAFCHSANHADLQDSTIDPIHRLFDFYDRYGITVDGDILRCLLGRSPITFADYDLRESGVSPSWQRLPEAPGDLTWD